jgi:hypothetical protein
MTKFTQVVKCKVVSLFSTKAPRHEGVWGMDVQIHTFLPQLYGEMSCQLHVAADLPQRKDPHCTHRICG